MKYKIEHAGGDFIFHWFVLMLGALKQIDLSSKVDVCTDYDGKYTVYQKETFQILDDIINLVPDNGDSQFLPSIKCLGAKNDSGIHTVDPTVYTFLRDLFLSRLHRMKKFDTFEYEKIYIRRNKSHLCEGNKQDNSAKRRQIINEDELVKGLQELGIKCINFEDYSVSEKIQIFQDSKWIIAPQSGGLVFSLFSGPSTSIIEIYPPDPHQYCDHYIDICNVLNVPFYRYKNVQKVDYYDNMIVESSEFIKYLRELNI